MNTLYVVCVGQCECDSWAAISMAESTWKYPDRQKQKKENKPLKTKRIRREIDGERNLQMLNDASTASPSLHVQRHCEWRGE